MILNIWNISIPQFNDNNSDKNNNTTLYNFNVLLLLAWL
jgi:hypothetical protein